MRDTSSDLGPAIGALVLAAFGFISVGIAILLPDSESFYLMALAVPGNYLFSVLSYAAIGLPVMIGVAAVLFMNGRFTLAGAVVLDLSVVPIIALAVAFRLILSPEASLAPFPAFISEAFSAQGGAVLMSLLAGASTLGLFQLHSMIEKRVATGARTDTGSESTAATPDPSDYPTEETEAHVDAHGAQDPETDGAEPAQPADLSSASSASSA